MFYMIQKSIKDRLTSIIDYIELMEPKINVEFEKQYKETDNVNVYKQLHYHTLLVAVFSTIEDGLKKLCNADQYRGFTTLKVKDLAGNNYIEKSRIYFDKVAEINLEPVSNEWRRIKEFQKIRNAIVHNNSRITFSNDSSIDKSTLFQILKKYKHVVIDNETGRFYICDKEFVLSIIKQVMNYLDFIISTLSEKKVIARNTTLPYNNDLWGEEKITRIIEAVIYCHEERRKACKSLVDDTEQYTCGILGNATKILSFFCDGEWSPGDGKYIYEYGKDGLKKLVKKYKMHGD